MLFAYIFQEKIKIYQLGMKKTVNVELKIVKSLINTNFSLLTFF